MSDRELYEYHPDDQQQLQGEIAKMEKLSDFVTVRPNPEAPRGRITHAGRDPSKASLPNRNRSV